MWGVCVCMGGGGTNVPLILKLCDVIFLPWINHTMGHYLGYLEGAKIFLIPKLS